MSGFTIFSEDVWDKWPPLWSSRQSFWLQIHRSRVPFPALPDLLRSSGSGTGSTHPREDNWGATWKESSGSGLENLNQRPCEFVALATRKVYPLKLSLTSPTSGGRSVGMVRACGLKPRSLFCFVSFPHRFHLYFRGKISRRHVSRPVAIYLLLEYANGNK
jgi:hypothetical protein